MEENKKVFIIGRKGHGSEIVNILTGLGAKPTDNTCDDENYVYFIAHNDKINCAPLGFEVSAIVMDNYKEIKLPLLPWKDRDVLVKNNYPYCYAAFKRYNDNGAFDAYFILDNKNAYFDATASVEHYHLANTKELEGLPRLFAFLMGALNEAGLCLPKNVAQNPLPDNEAKRLEEGDD